jgi:L-asparaginase II
MLAGTGRFCTELVRATCGRVVAKVGADGFYGAFAADAGIGIAVHVDDGAASASQRVLAAILRKLGLLSADEANHLDAFVGGVRRNHRGVEVGRAEVSLEGVV